MPAERKNGQLSVSSFKRLNKRMIHESSTSSGWILKIAKDKKADPILAQKAIRAFNTL
jgi:hypothetical protein